jgi:hypothetical protein
MNLTPRCLALIALLAFTSHEAPAQTAAGKATTGCQFSSPPKSTLSWESGLAQGQDPSTAVLRDAIVGRVISVGNGEPVTDAVIRLDPGDHLVRVDSTGRFAFPPLPQGRYRVNVMSSTSGSAADSVTLGFDGLRIVAALARYTGDIVCEMPVRKPSNER